MGYHSTWRDCAAKKACVAHRSKRAGLLSAASVFNDKNVFIDIFSDDAQKLAADTEC